MIDVLFSLITDSTLLGLVSGLLYFLVVSFVLNCVISASLSFLEDCSIFQGKFQCTLKPSALFFIIFSLFPTRIIWDLNSWLSCSHSWVVSIHWSYPSMSIHTFQTLPVSLMNFNSSIDVQFFLFLCKDIYLIITLPSCIVLVFHLWLLKFPHKSNFISHFEASFKIVNMWYGFFRHLHLIILCLIWLHFPWHSYSSHIASFVIFFLCYLIFSAQVWL